MSVVDIPPRAYILHSSCSDDIKEEYAPTAALQMLMTPSSDVHMTNDDLIEGLEGLVENFGSLSALVELAILKNDMGLLRACEAVTAAHPMAMYLVAETDARIDLHQAAAAMGYIPSVHCVGVHFEGADEEERDLVAAYRHYMAAAEAGYAPSMLNLGKLYLTGELLGRGGGGGKAKYWLEQARAAGCREATMLLLRLPSTTTVSPPSPAGKMALAAADEDNDDDAVAADEHV
eukprot:PhM_4_TR6926/c0_g1_i1/m.80617